MTPIETFLLGGAVTIGVAIALRITVTEPYCPDCDDHHPHRLNFEHCPNCGTELTEQHTSNAERLGRFIAQLGPSNDESSDEENRTTVEEVHAQAVEEHREEQIEKFEKYLTPREREKALHRAVVEKAVRDRVGGGDRGDERC